MVWGVGCDPPNPPDIGGAGGGVGCGVWGSGEVGKWELGCGVWGSGKWEVEHLAEISLNP